MRNRSFTRRTARNEDRVRKLELKPDTEGGVGPWIDLFDFITSGWIFFSEQVTPAIRLNNGFAEMKGAIWADGDYDGGAVNDIPLPLEYVPPTNWAETFLIMDDDGAFDWAPYGGGWGLDVGGRTIFGASGMMFIQQAPFVFNLDGPVTMEYPQLSNNFGWPVSTMKIQLEGVRWAVEN